MNIYYLLPIASCLLVYACCLLPITYRTHRGPADTHTNTHGHKHTHTNTQTHMDLKSAIQIQQLTK